MRPYQRADHRHTYAEESVSFAVAAWNGEKVARRLRRASGTRMFT